MIIADSVLCALLAIYYFELFLCTCANVYCTFLFNLYEVVSNKIILKYFWNNNYETLCLRFYVFNQLTSLFLISISAAFWQALKQEAKVIIMICLHSVMPFYR